MSGAKGTLKFALQYAELGYLVIPVCYKTKKPKIANWISAATIDPVVIRNWWAQGTWNNVGIRTGEGFVVVDVDDRTAAPPEVINALEALGGPKVVTSRGCHYWVRCVGVEKTFRIPGCDIKATGFVLAPPSTHPNDTRYKFERLPTRIEDLPEFPAELLMKYAVEGQKIFSAESGAGPLAPSTLVVWDPEEYVDGALRKACQRVAQAGAGERNNTLNREAFGIGQLVGNGDLTETRAHNELTIAALEADLDAPEAARTVASGLSAGMAQRRVLVKESDLPRGSSASGLGDGDDGNGALPDYVNIDPDGILKLDRHKFAEFIRVKCRFTLGPDNNLWRYCDGVYRSDGFRYVGTAVREELQSIRHPGWWSNVLDKFVSDWIVTHPPFAAADGAVTVLNVRNGLLDFSTLELRPHDPEYISTVQLPHRWLPDATCPRFDAFLSSVLPEESVRLVWELLGYALLGTNPYQKAVLLLGPGGNGKSVLLHAITQLLGQTNVSTIPLQLFAENRFASAHLYGKLANICGDLDARALKQTDVFKQITGGDRIYAEHKGKDGFAFKAGALLMFSANEAPGSADASDAWFVRWLIVPMTVGFRVSAVT